MDENNKVIHSSFWANLFKATAEKNDLEKLLRAIPPFHELNKKDLSLLSTIIHQRSYLAGEYIFYQDDPGIGLYIIREGEVKVQRIVEEGTVIPLASFDKGDFFGELALIDGAKRTASAIAVTDVRLAVIFKPDLDEFVERYPKKGIKILQGIAQVVTIRLRQLNEEHISLLTSLKINSEKNYGT